jgi:hypothetical protein
MWRFIVLFERPLAECLHIPLHSLENALVALEANQVEPIIRPVPHCGRSVSSDARAALKGCAAGTVRRLCEQGVGRLDACRKVANTLNKLGVRPERGAGHVTATTIRHWCDSVAEDVSRSGPAATVHDDMFTAEENARFASIRKDQAEAFALASLRAFVLSVKPGAPKKPLKPLV